MEKVNGIGGVFFLAKKPDGLSRWYREYLGVECAPPTYDAAPWRQDAGPAVFAPLPESTTYFGDARRTWIIDRKSTRLNSSYANIWYAVFCLKKKKKKKQQYTDQTQKHTLKYGTATHRR